MAIGCKRRTIQVAGAIRYAEPKTTDFPASLFAFIEEAENAGPSNKYWKRVVKEDLVVRMD